MAETVAVIHRVLPSGSSFPSVVETGTGRRYVLKLSGAGPGRRSLVTEYVALKLAKRLGLNVPDAEVLDVPHDFLWQAGTDEFYEAVQRSAGANLGVAFLAESQDVEASELTGLPEDFAHRLAAIDALFQNVDRTAVNPNIMRDAAGVYWAVDFGACLLIERLARGAIEPRLDLPSNHFLAGTAGLASCVRAAAAAIDAQHLRTIVEALPDAWLDDLGLTRSALQERLTTYVKAVRGA